VTTPGGDVRDCFECKTEPLHDSEVGQTELGLAANEWNVWCKAIALVVQDNTGAQCVGMTVHPILHCVTALGLIHARGLHDSRSQVVRPRLRIFERSE
jgi:hypothetical protein